MFQFTSLHFGLATGPQELKGVKIIALLRKLRLHQFLDDLADQVVVLGLNTVSDRNWSLQWIINQIKCEINPTQVFLYICELRIPSRFNPCKIHSREMAQISGFDPVTKVETVLTARCLMSLIELLASVEERVLEGLLYMTPFQFHLKEHWRHLQSLDSLLP